MPLNRKKNCMTCKVITSESPKDLRHSRLYQLIDLYHLKGTTLTAIAAEYKGKLNYLPIRNHALKHQNPSAQALVKSAQKEVTQRAKIEAVQVMRKHNDVRQGLIDKLETAFDSGEVKPTLAGLVSLLKQEADIEEKQKDRQFEMAKMIAKFQSGELERLK